MTVQPRWQSLADSLRGDNPGRYFSKDEVRRFDEFVATVPRGERVAMLLDAYQAYRQSAGMPASAEQHFEGSVASVLISALLKSRLVPNEQQTCEILKSSFHRCGHGDDVEPPIRFVEKAFQGKPFTPQLFEAARAYRDTLRGLTSTPAQDGKRKLNWIIWHDVSKPDGKCFTGSIQKAIARMDRDEAFAWQWLLRNTAPGYLPGKGWFVEAERRMNRLGHPRFLARWNEWVRVPDGIVRISPAGSQMLRLMVYYAMFFPPEAVAQTALRLTTIAWKNPEPAYKVIGSVATLLAGHVGLYRAEAAQLCRRFASVSTEVARLREVIDPAAVATRKAEEERKVDEEFGAAIQNYLARSNKMILDSSREIQKQQT